MADGPAQRRRRLDQCKPCQRLQGCGILPIAGFRLQARVGKMSDKKRWDFPYLVIRRMPAVYERREITFTADREGNVLTPEVLILSEPQPFDHNGNLSKRCRARLLELALRESKKSDRQICLVFGEDDCVYVRPDGTASASPQPPREGLWFKFRRKSALL